VPTSWGVPLPNRRDLRTWRRPVSLEDAVANAQAQRRTAACEASAAGIGFETSDPRRFELKRPYRFAFVRDLSARSRALAADVVCAAVDRRIEVGSLCAARLRS